MLREDSNHHQEATVILSWNCKISVLVMNKRLNNISKFSLILNLNIKKIVAGDMIIIMEIGGARVGLGET